ncbi:MAG: hypothetical protein COA43_00465 [Robiginitomaculum sp.]|nr:MAG: hypothetical protein COA43_00465 [Robiginitomaculum sp.]
MRRTSEADYEKVKEWGEGALMLRGGQTSLHTLRMASDVVKYVVGFYLICGFLFVGYKASVMPTNEKQAMMQVQLVRFNKMIYPHKLDKPANFVETRVVDGHIERSTIELTLNSFENHPTIIHYYTQGVSKIKRWSFWTTVTIAITSLLSMFFFSTVGRRIIKTQHFRGARIVEKLQLIDIVLDKNRALEKKMWINNYTPYVIGGVPYIYGTEKQHTLICGRTGAGKTQEILKLLSQIRYYNHDCVVFDYMGSYLETHYNPQTDYILNPMDTRCAAWDFFSDANSKEDFHTVAAALIAESKDPFWSKSARTIFVSTAYKYYSQSLEGNSKPKLKTFLDLLMKGRPSTLADYLGDTEASALFLISGVSGSILATLTSALAPLYAMVEYQHEAVEPFSISEWIKCTDQKGFLFITSRSDQHEALKPLITLWADIAIRSLVSGPRHKNRFVFFMLDELPALAKLPSLITGLTQGRQFGAAYILGIQQRSQLEAIYDRHDTATLFGNCATKLIFSVNCPETAEYLSKTIGRAHTAARDENISYGAETVRDGRNIMTRREKEYVILPEQISALPNLDAYLKLSGELPVARVSTKYIDWPIVQARFEQAEKVPVGYSRQLNKTLKQLETDLKRGDSKTKSTKPEPEKTKQKETNQSSKAEKKPKPTKLYATQAKNNGSTKNAKSENLLKSYVPLMTNPTKLTSSDRSDEASLKNRETEQDDTDEETNANSISMEEPSSDELKKVELKNIKKKRNKKKEKKKRDEARLQARISDEVTHEGNEGSQEIEQAQHIITGFEDFHR